MRLSVTSITVSRPGCACQSGLECQAGSHQWWQQPTWEFLISFVSPPLLPGRLTWSQLAHWRSSWFAGLWVCWHWLFSLHAFCPNIDLFLVSEHFYPRAPPSNSWGITSSEFYCQTWVTFSLLSPVLYLDKQWSGVIQISLHGLGNKHFKIL